MSASPQFPDGRRLRASPILSHVNTGDICLHYINGEKFALGVHYHTQHQIIISPDTNSECELTWRKQSGQTVARTIKGQNIIYIRSGTLHSFTSSGKGMFLSLGVSESEALRLTMGNLWDDVRITEWWKILKHDIFVWNIVQVFRIFCRQKHQPHARDFGALAHTLAAHLLTIERRQKATTSEGLTGWQLRNVDAHIESHFRDKLTVSELAAVAGLKKDHFSHLFKTSTGMSPHRYIIARRIGYAQELLKLGKMTLADIAVEAGFYDQSHYGHCVKHFCANAPEHYPAILPRTAQSSNLEGE